MSKRPVTNDERMARAKTKARARETSPATVRTRSSPQVSLAWRIPGSVVHQAALGAVFFFAAEALAVRFLRLPLLPLDEDSGSLSESRVFFAMGSTNLNAQQARGLWGGKASSRKGVQKALRKRENSLSLQTNSGNYGEERKPRSSDFGVHRAQRIWHARHVTIRHNEEPQEHTRPHGGEEVQPHSPSFHFAQRDQVTSR